jgi:hypothetical protein
MRSRFLLSIAALLWATQMNEGASPIEPPDSQDLAECRKCIADSGPLYEEGWFSEAAQALEKAVRYAELAPLDPRLPRTINALGFLYQEQGIYSKAAVLLAAFKSHEFGLRRWCPGPVTR